MHQTTSVRRVVVIVDATLRDQMLEKFMELGAHGYNTIKCGGKGAHAITGDFFHVSNDEELLRIEIICSMAVGAAILDYIHAVQFQQFGNYALTAFADTVEADVRDRSLTGQ